MEERQGGGSVVQGWARVGGGAPDREELEENAAAV